MGTISRLLWIFKHIQAQTPVQHPYIGLPMEYGHTGSTQISLRLLINEEITIS